MVLVVMRMVTTEYINIKYHVISMTEEIIKLFYYCGEYLNKNKIKVNMQSVKGSIVHGGEPFNGD